MAAASLEYRTLIACSHQLVNQISEDPSTVAQVLFAEGLVAPALTEEMDRQDKANKIVTAITKKVLLNERNYDKRWGSLTSSFGFKT